MFRVWRRDYREHVIWPPDYLKTGTWWLAVLLLIFERVSKFYQNKLSKPLPKNLIRPLLSTPYLDHQVTYPLLLRFMYEHIDWSPHWLIHPRCEPQHYKLHEGNTMKTQCSHKSIIPIFHAVEAVSSARDLCRKHATSVDTLYTWLHEEGDKRGAFKPEEEKNRRIFGGIFCNPHKN